MHDRAGRTPGDRRGHRCGRGVRHGAPALTRTLGLVGTLVRDRFETDAGAVECWGGLGYGIAAAAAARGDEWRIRPIVKVGDDLAEEARAHLSRVPHVDARGVCVVPEPNNRVTLRYVDDAERVERLTGGVPGWTIDELGPHLEECDALLVNFISGYEAGLHTCQTLRSDFDGPIHADLHSLFLGQESDGTRVPRPLADFEAWVGCFDSVQLNDVEAGLATDATRLDAGTAEAFATRVTLRGPDVCTVTLGSAGACWAARSSEQPSRWSMPRPDGARVDSGSVTIRSPRRGDPTGCGDVWGAAFFTRTLAGDPVPEAAEIATRLAARNVEHRGAEGLYTVLAREVAL